MVDIRPHLTMAARAIRAQRLRAFLTVLGITMGVATLMAVITLVQGANTYVEQKIANLGTNVFQVSKMPFATTSFDQIIKARRPAQQHRLKPPAEKRGGGTLGREHRKIHLRMIQRRCSNFRRRHSHLHSPRTTRCHSHRWQQCRGRPLHQDMSLQATEFNLVCMTSLPDPHRRWCWQNNMPCEP